MGLLDDVLGRCENVRSLAEGGQKLVLAADHPEFGSVVVKYGEYRFATSLERISREVDLLRDLDSPYYPRQHEFLIEPLRREFLVVEERLDAVELDGVRDRFNDDSAILKLLRELACALDCIWRRNVVHRDLKPANILITDTNAPRIIDLGIARFLDDVSLTHTYALQGPATPIYAAPEQLQNRKTLINHRTDFFLLGLLVLELMLGAHPFDPLTVGNDATLVENLLSGTRARPSSDRDPILSGFADSVLDRKPFRRFRTVEQLFSHLGLERGGC